MTLAARSNFFRDFVVDSDRLSGTEIFIWEMVLSSTPLPRVTLSAVCRSDSDTLPYFLALMSSVSQNFAGTSCLYRAVKFSY